MTRFLIGVLTGVILAGLALVILAFAAIRLAGRPPSIADGSTLVLRLDSEIPEQAPMSIPLPFFEEKEPLTVGDVWRILRRVETDSRIKAVVLFPGGTGAGWGKLQEIRSGLARVRAKRKPLVAFLRTARTRDYFLATAADRIYMTPEDFLDVKGLRAEVTYFRNTLDKLGVQVEIEHAGRYKDFGDAFTRSSMSPETREVLDSILDDLYGQIVSTVAEGRRKTVEETRAVIDEGPFLSKEALNRGLVDALVYEDQMFDEVEKRLGQKELQKVGARDYLRAINAESRSGERIALVVAEGSITGGSGDDWSGDSGIHAEQFARLLREVSKDRSVRGVVLRVDSPGGSAFASDEIWREMNSLSRLKPVVISMSDSAASGGYYIAMTGDPVVAYPGTMTGSIGVVFGKLNLRGLYDKIGIKKEILTRGQFADIDSDYRPLSDAARKKLRGGLDENYRAFVQKVADARKRKFEEIEPLAQGRVWLGSQAKKNGLVDELGGIDRAVELVRRKAHLSDTEPVNLVVYPPKQSIVERLFGKTKMSAWDGRIGELLKDVRANALIEGGVMRLCPYTIDVR